MPLHFDKGATLLYLKKDEKTKLHGFYESLALQHECPVKYNLCEQLLYGLYCPSVKDKDHKCIFVYCQKICTTKTLLKLPLKATQHHSYSAVGDYESEVQNVDKVEDASVIPDRPCLILWMKVFLMDTFETTYE